MTFFLELKQRIISLVGKREKWVLAAAKFIIALVAFVLINHFVGYMEMAGNPILLVLMAAACAFTPISLTLFFGVVLILVNFYALAMELCVIALLLFILMFILFFRFTKGSGYFAVLTPIFSFLRIPYVLPNAVGMTGKPYNVVAVICGTMTYFLVKNVHENEALFRAFEESISGASKFTLAINQIFVNKEMYLYMVAYVVAAIVVYFVRKTSMDRSWGASVLIGSVIQLVFVGGGMVALGHVRQLPIVFIGSLIGLLLSAGLMFIIRPLDYSRVERVEFEDEDYYYYVKAVPKAYVAMEDREVKQIVSKKHKAVKAPGRLKKNGNVQIHPEGVQPEELKPATQEPQPVETETVKPLEKATEDTSAKKTEKKSGKTSKKKNRKKSPQNTTEKPSAEVKKDEIAKKAMEEFDVEGEWLE